MMNQGEARQERGGVALGAMAILVCAAVVGLLHNHFSRYPLPPFATEASLRPPVAANVTFVDLAGGKSMFDAGAALFVDARPPEEYASGHVPGAVNLPADEFDKARAGLAETLRKAQAIVCYCEGLTCERSSSVANRLGAAGYAHVFLMFSGWDEWEAAGYPSERAGRS